jgi:hypothetical protein
MAFRAALTLPSASPVGVRGYAAAAGISKEDIQSRVLDVMKTFEKVDGGKVRRIELVLAVGSVGARKKISGASCCRRWEAID